MKILITGAFGNLGLMCIEQAMADGHTLRCFDLDTAANRKAAQKLSGIEAVFGDLRDADIQASLVKGVDAIIHNASLLPPATETLAALAQQVNVDACKALIDLIAQCETPPLFIFPSSVTVFGLAQSNDSFKSASDELMVSDNYTSHKIAIEEYLQSTAIPWVILRVGVAVDARTLKTDRATFKHLLSVDKDNPMEYVHPKDIAKAMCNAANTPDAVGKVLLLGGGKACQITHRKFIRTAFNALGLVLPESIHGSIRYYTHWMDTEEAQQLLQFQQHSFDDYVQQMHDKLKPWRYLLWPLRFIINPLLPKLLRAL